MMQPKPDTLDPVAGQKSLILGGHDFHSITEVVSSVLERKAPLGWWAVLGVALLMLGGLAVGVPWLFWEGIGVWGLNIPVGWAWDITNFVFWVGIGHAGTLISAILLLFRQKWRTSINRAAEAMTIFAVHVRAHLPGHPRRPRLGRLLAARRCRTRWAVWPNFRSPLLWDVFAVSIYGTVSLLFWYVGLIPDLATMRDRSKTQDPAVDLRRLRARLARLAAALAALRGRVPDPGRPRDAARALGPLDRLDGLRGLAAPGLAHHDLPALLRRRRDLLRLRDGGHADGDLPQGLRPRADHHDPALRLHGQDHPGHGLDGRLRLRAWSSSSPGTAATRTRSTCS